MRMQRVEPSVLPDTRLPLIIVLLVLRFITTDGLFTGLVLIVARFVLNHDQDQVSCKCSLLSSQSDL